MSTPLTHRLVVPAAEGGELIFAHSLDGGVRVWMRGLVRRVDESPRRLRGVAAPLYGGSLSDVTVLRDFLTDFADHTVADPAAVLTPGRIRDTRPLPDRTGLKSVSSRVHFSYRSVSPMHTCGRWDGAAAELLISRVRGLDGRSDAGYYVTGLPELPADADLDALPAGLHPAVIGRAWAEGLAEFLRAPVGQVLHHLERRA